MAFTPGEPVGPSYLPGGAGYFAGSPPVDTDPPPWWAWWNIKPAVYQPIADGSWLVMPKVQFGDATGDDGVNVNYAAEQAASAGGLVRFAPGVFNIAAPIVLPSGTRLQGAGMQTTMLKLAPGSPALMNMIANDTSPANMCQVADLTLDGNKANNAGTWQSGIVWQNPNPGPLYTDGRHQVSRVMVQNFTGDGIVQTGRGGSHFTDCQVFLCDGFGMNVHEDCYLTGISCGACGIDGMLVQGGSNRLANIKCWFAGAKLVSSRIDGATLLTVNPPANDWDGGGVAGLVFSLANGWGNGIHWRSITGGTETPNNAGGSYGPLGAQDNARAGFFVTGRKHVLQAVEADSNNNCGTNAGVPNGSFAGVDAGCTDCLISGRSWDRAANVNHQAAALNLVSSGGNNVKNSIQLTFSGTLNDGSNMPPLTAGSTLFQNDVRFAAQGRSFSQVAFAATVTPDPFGQEVFSMTLTGAITVNAPALSGTNTTGLFLVPGMKLTLSFTQDGVGGRVVTLNAVFRLNGHAFTGVAGATSAIEFVWDGSFWQAIG